MNLAQSLLQTADALLTIDPRRPKQSNLRRSISTSYYALFHLLTREAARQVVSERVNEPTHAAVCRALDHGEMQRACRSFQAGYGGLPITVRALLSSVPPDVQIVASAFVLLQQQRHEADYNVGRSFSRTQADLCLVRAREAFAAWERAKRLPEAQTFLLALLFGQRWNRS